MLKNVVNIDIGSSQIKLVQVSQSSGKIRLEKIGVVSNPVPNFRTTSQSPGKDTIARAIRHSLRENRIKARDVVSSLGGSSIIVQYFKFPPLSGKELENAVNLEAQRVMGSKLNEMETDFQVLPQNQKGAGEQEILFAAVPKKLVQQHMETLQQAGLNPIAIDIDCLALANCFLRLKNLASEEDVMLLNLGARLISLGILGKESLHFVRDISLDLKAPLDLKEKSILDRTVEKLHMSIHYYEDRAPGKKVARIFLTGGGSMASEISNLFSKALGLPVEKWNPLQYLEFESGKLAYQFKESQGYLLAIAIGLSLREK
ncbi:pilus assembly protein PilM [Candidatus Aerophobetes bacterium]|nr:pilus assembly protein PilM [Candidatus Aerophobetes bacterium]